MDLIIFLFETVFEGAVSSIPLIMTCLLLITFEVSPKATASCLLLHLITSIFFLVKLKAISLSVFQGVIYVFCFLYIREKNEQRKMNQNNENGELQE